MRLTGLGPLLLLLGLSARAAAQAPPAAPAPPAPAQDPVPPPGPPPPPDAPPVPPTPEPEPPPVPAPASAPAPEAAPPIVPEPEPPSATRSEAAPGATSKAPAPSKDEPELPPFERAKWPLTVDLKLGMAWRPEGDAGFDAEDRIGTELGGSLYLDITDKIGAGLEVDRASLGRGNSINGFNSISVDYSDLSAMLGLRAYPRRGELLDLFVGIQVGVGIQGVSATGTTDNGLQPATPYSCSGSDSPGFQIGGGIGARLMLAPRWGITARVNGTGRKLTPEVINDCARGLGSLTTVSGSLAVGYDFDLEG
jgi:hypothetical protein